MTMKKEVQENKDCNTGRQPEQASLLSRNEENKL